MLFWPFPVKSSPVRARTQGVCPSDHAPQNNILSNKESEMKPLIWSLVLLWLHSSVQCNKVEILNKYNSVGYFVTWKHRCSKYQLAQAWTRPLTSNSSSRRQRQVCSAVQLCHSLVYLKFHFFIPKLWHCSVHIAQLLKRKKKLDSRKQEPCQQTRKTST